MSNFPNCERCGQEADARIHTQRPGSWSGHRFVASPQVTVTVRITKRFYDDHVARGLPAGRIVKELKGGYYVELDHEAFAELLDDAIFYGEPDMPAELGREYFGLIASARATAAALLRIDTPWKEVTQ